MSSIYPIDTVSYPNSLGKFYDFYVNNTFYLLAPPYYQSFYSLYLNRCISAYDGWINGYYNLEQGLVPQRMLQSVARGLNNMLFAHGIDFRGERSDYKFACKWAKKHDFGSALAKAHLFDIAGGTALLKINRSKGELFVTGHRVDTFYPDIDSNGNVTSIRIYMDSITNANPTGNVNESSDKHYGICEERYFNEQGIPCIKATCYRTSGSVQSDVAERQLNAENVKWEQLPYSVKRYIKKNYPSIMLDKEQYLPFYDNLGCYIIKFTQGIPQLPNSPFGQPIGDILFDENFQYDQLKYFEKNEVDLARARALIPEEFWNKDDPNYDEHALSERFYQQISSTEQVTPIQFNMRAEDIRIQRENILKDIAFKLNVSASSVASFLDDGQGSMTATQIISEKTKSDTWIKSQINLITPVINDLLATIMRYYGKNPVEIVLKAEDQSPFLERLKGYSDVYSAGNMSDEMFVKSLYKNATEEEQEREIEWLKHNKARQEAMQDASVNAWQDNNND